MIGQLDSGEKGTGYSQRRLPGMVRGFLLLAVCLGAPRQGVAQGLPSQTRIDRYVADGQFDKAELLCREPLSDSGLPLTQRAGYTVELIRVLVEKGRKASPVQREEILKQATLEAASALRRDPDSLVRNLVRFQAALIPRYRARWQRFDPPASGSATRHQQALMRLRETVLKLKALREDLSTELRQFGRRDPGEPGHLSRRELMQLRSRVELETGITYADQGEAFPAGSEDRMLAGLQGADVLTRLSPSSLSPEWWLVSRLELLRCLRIKGDWRRFVQEMQTLEGTRLSEQTRPSNDGRVDSGCHCPRKLESAQGTGGRRGPGSDGHGK